MFQAKLINHKSTMVDIPTREEGIKFMKDISKDGRIADPVMILKGFQFSVTKDEDEENLLVSMVLSTEDVDRDEERIVQSGWMLDEFKSNPVIL